MWLKKMKKRKMQHFIIAFILMISTAILLACISFTLETSRFVDDYYSYDKCPIYFDIVSDVSAVDILNNDDTVMQLLDHVDSCESKYVQEEFSKDDEKLNNDSILVYALDDVDSLEYDLPITDGDDVNHPGDGDMWICRVFADATGLEVGDRFTIGDNDGTTYTISAIVDSPECSSGFMDNYPCYVNSDTLHAMTGREAYGIQMYAKNEDVTIKDLEKTLPEEYDDLVLVNTSSDTLKMCLSILSGIFGGVGVAAAILILGVSVIVIRYMVRSVIDKEYHMIGVYMAIGKSSKDIKVIYFTSYIVTGLVGILVGIILGRPLATYLAKEIISGMKGFSLTYVTNVITIFVVLFMVGVLAINIWLELKKINKITPVQALATGIRSSKKNISRSVIKNAHSSLSVAVNQLFKSKSMTVLIMLVLTVSFYTCLMSGAVGLSLAHYSDDKEVWENLPDYDGYIKIVNDEKVLDYLKNSDMIEDLVDMSFTLDNIKMSFEDCDLTMGDANPMVYSEFTEERYADVPYTAGRICTNPREITVSEQFLDKVNRKVGDYLTIYLNDKPVDFLIVGSYSAMMRGGVSFYIQEQDVIDAGTTPELDTVLFFLKDDVTYDEFEKEFKSVFSDSKIYEDFKFIEQEGETVTDIAYPICIVLFAAFSAFSILNIVNVVYTQNRENRKMYGILKSMGFSTGYICRINIFKLTIESIIAVILTVILHEILSPVLFSLACGIKFIYKPVWLTVSVCSGLYLAIMLVTVIMLLTVRKISPVELMEE